VPAAASLVTPSARHEKPRVSLVTTPVRVGPTRLQRSLTIHGNLGLPRGTIRADQVMRRNSLFWEAQNIELK
jgi:hypothetical protein